MTKRYLICEKEVAVSDLGPSARLMHTTRGRRFEKTQEKSRSAGFLDTSADARMSQKSICHLDSR
jgi:hypothetical protein